MLNEMAKDVFIKAGLTEEINGFQQFLEEYDNRYIRIIKPQKEKPKRLLGQNGLHYAQLALYRSKILLEGSIEAINNKNALSAILSARAHLEVAGGLAYFYKKLNNFYKGVITFDEIDKSLRRLLLGGRIEELPNVLDPINVMSLIDAVDDFYKNKIPEKVSMFRKSYDFLSEFCHPNCYGITMGCYINSNAIVRYNNLPTLSGKDLVFIHYLSMSCSSSLKFYDMIYKLLSENEELPTIIK